MISPAFSIFVNSSDSYADCWGPFFKLFRRYWPECPAPIWLNTERIEWRSDDADVRCTRVQEGIGERLTWSECLRAGLARVSTPLVLYCQEDYFLHRRVLHSRIIDAVEYMREEPAVRHIGLTKHGSCGPHEPYEVPGLLRIRQKALYRISTQAGLWRTDALTSYLEPCENGWMFEIYGTWRAHRRDELFLTLDCDRAYGGPAIDYLHTGIIKGQWLPEIVEVFSSHGVEVDFSARGFYRSKSVLARKLETARRLLEHPRYFLAQLLGLANR